MPDAEVDVSSLSNLEGIKIVYTVFWDFSSMVSCMAGVGGSGKVWELGLHISLATEDDTIE